MAAQVSMNHWGSEGPPPEAYSRFTNPERFRPLHAFMVELIGRLERAFDVERVEEDGPGDVFEGCEFAYPGARLQPRDLGAAAIVVAFTTFPGLRIQVGRWYIDAFPGCGCDACAESRLFVLQKVNNGLMAIFPGIVKSDLTVGAGEGTAGAFV